MGNFGMIEMGLPKKIGWGNNRNMIDPRK